MRPRHCLQCKYPGLVPHFRTWSVVVLGYYIYRSAFSNWKIVPARAFSNPNSVYLTAILITLSTNLLRWLAPFRLDKKMNNNTRQISKKGVLGLIADLSESGCSWTTCLSADTLAERGYGHLLPDCEPERSRVADALSAVGRGDTGIVVFCARNRTVAIEPPFPLDVDVKASGVASAPLVDLLESEPVIGVVMLRLGRYAVGVLRGETLLATKTDTRYMKNRHRAGGQSQRRFERSRERLIRELFDKCCEVTRTVFGPYLSDIDHVLLGGERGSLDGFAKRCRLIRDLEPKTLSRRLPVDRPNQAALERAPYEVWKSSVTELGVKC